jgi:hypothetical protein
MLITQINQLLQMSVGTCPEAITGVLSRLSKVYAGKEGTPDAWTIQRAQIRGDDGSQMEVCFSSRPVLTDDMNGKRVYIQAAKGERGLYGLKRKEDEYQGKVTQQIWVFSGATMSLDDSQADGGQNQAANPQPNQNQAPEFVSQQSGYQQQHQEPQQQAQPNQQQAQPNQQQAQPNQPQQAQANQQGGAGSDDMVHGMARTEFNKYKIIHRNQIKSYNAMRLCINTSHGLSKHFQSKTGMAMSSEQLQTLATSLFIEMGRRGDVEAMTNTVVPDEVMLR